MLISTLSAQVDDKEYLSQSFLLSCLVYLVGLQELLRHMWCGTKGNLTKACLCSSYTQFWDQFLSFWSLQEGWIFWFYVFCLTFFFFNMPVFYLWGKEIHILVLSFSFSPWDYSWTKECLPVKHNYCHKHVWKKSRKAVWRSSPSTRHNLNFLRVVFCVHGILSYHFHLSNNECICTTSFRFSALKFLSQDLIQHNWSAKSLACLILNFFKYISWLRNNWFKNSNYG